MQFRVELEGIFQCFRGVLNLLRRAKSTLSHIDRAFVNRKGQLEPFGAGSALLDNGLLDDVCLLIAKMDATTFALLPVRRAFPTRAEQVLDGGLVGRVGVLSLLLLSGEGSCKGSLSDICW